MAEPRFTIIATVRNEAGTIRDFVDSLRGQTRKPDEIGHLKKSYPEPVIGIQAACRDAAAFRACLFRL